MPCVATKHSSIEIVIVLPNGGPAVKLYLVYVMLLCTSAHMLVMPWVRLGKGVGFARESGAVAKSGEARYGTGCGNPLAFSRLA